VRCGVSPRNTTHSSENQARRCGVSIGNVTQPKRDFEAHVSETDIQFTVTEWPWIHPIPPMKTTLSNVNYVAHANANYRRNCEEKQRKSGVIQAQFFT
jgi:hypothetical protein